MNYVYIQSERAGRQICKGYKPAREIALGGKCSTCGKVNQIVNQCRCDPNNLPTRPVSGRSARVKLASLFLAAVALVGCEGGGGYYGGSTYTAPACSYGAAPARGYNIYGPDGVTMVVPNGF